MRLLATALCLFLVACASPRPAAVEEPPPSPLAGLALVPADSSRTFFGLDIPAYRALLHSGRAWNADSLRSSTFEVEPSLRQPFHLPDSISSEPSSWFERGRGAAPLILRAPSNCDRAIPMPQVAAPDTIPPVPMPRLESGGPPPVPMPNLCGPYAR